MSERITPFQEMLQEAYKEYLLTRNKHRVSDTEFSRWLGVKQSTFSQWVNGNREPDLASAIVLSRRLGPRVYDVLGMPRVEEISETSLKFIVDNWKYLPDETRKQIYEHVKEESTRRTPIQPPDRR